MNSRRCNLRTISGQTQSTPEGLTVARVGLREEKNFSQGDGSTTGECASAGQSGPKVLVLERYSSFR